MDFVWSTALKDLRRYRRDPLGFVLWIGIPLVVGSLIVLASGGKEGARPQAHLLISDDDNGAISNLLIGALSQEAMGGFVRAEEVGKEEGLDRMEEGDATALLIIPDGFGRAVLLEDPVTMELITNPSQRILPGIVEESLRVLIDGVFYLHRLIGEDLREFALGPPDGRTAFPDERIADFSVRVNRMMEGMSRYFSPLLIDLETKVEGDDESTADNENIGVFFLPGILFMALLFMAQGISADLWEEREKRTLLRAIVSPHSVFAFLLGKMLSGLILMFLICLMALSIGYAYLDLGPNTLPMAVLWSTISGAILTVMLMMIQLFASNRRAGNILTMILIFPLMMVGGSFFPFEAMPDWMASIGKLTPNGWAVEQLKSILLERSDLQSIGVTFLGILLVFVLLFLMCGLRLRTRFAKG